MDNLSKELASTSTSASTLQTINITAMSIASSARKRGLRWKKHVVAGAGRRYNHSATLVGSSVYVYGGYERHGRVYRNDFVVVERTGTDFEESKLPTVSFPAPPRRSGHTADLVDDQLFVLGGFMERSTLTEVWVFDLLMKTWWLPSVRGTPHEMMARHSSEYIEWMDCILCFGGGDGIRFENSITCFYVTTMEWKKLIPKGTPPKPRSDASTCLVNTTCYVFGGLLYARMFNDLHLLELPMNGSKPFWSSPAVLGRPAPRYSAGMAYLWGSLLLFGGNTQRGPYNDIHIFDLRTQTWQGTRVVQAGTDDSLVDVDGEVPTRRFGHSLTPMPKGTFLVYGGCIEAPRGPGCVYTLEAA